MRSARPAESEQRTVCAHPISHRLHEHGAFIADRQAWFRVNKPVVSAITLPGRLASAQPDFYGRAVSKIRLCHGARVLCSTLTNKLEPSGKMAISKPQAATRLAKSNPAVSAISAGSPQNRGPRWYPCRARAR